MRLALMIAMVLSMAHSASGPQVTVRVLDGRNGRPMKDQVIEVWNGERTDGVPRQVKTDDFGAAVLAFNPQKDSFVISFGYSPSGKWLADCRPLPSKNSTKSLTGSYVYHFSEVLQRGIVAENTCGKLIVEPEPAEFVFFGRPAHWWEKMRE